MCIRDSLNTNVATAVAMLAWFFLDISLNRKLSFLGAINGLICGLVAITPAAGYVDGYGAIVVGLFGAVVPWLTMNKLSGRWPFRRVDDTLGIIHTHFTAGAVGGILVGLIANPAMVCLLYTSPSPTSAHSGRRRHPRSGLRGTLPPPSQRAVCSIPASSATAAGSASSPAAVRSRPGKWSTSLWEHFAA